MVATLHVRNVPDQLYETLRVSAELEGRPIGAQAVALLQKALAGDPSFHHKLRPGLRLGPTFLRDARRAVALAQDEVRELGHDEVGTEHLLLGLLRLERGLARALAKPPLGLEPGEVRRRVGELRPASPEPVAGQIPFTPGAKRALEQALREALAAKDRHIGPEHVLLGVAAVEEEPGAQILRDLGADPNTLRAALLQSFVGARHAFAGFPPPLLEPEEDWSYRAVTLTGSADDWTAALNDLGADGWELLTIVPQPEPRAVFRRPGTETE